MSTNNNALTNVNNINISLGQTPGAAQINFIVRAIYFLLIGWWFSAIWVSVAWFFAITILGLPVASWMFNRTNKILTLAR